jgi:hypothetical protein
MRRYMLPILSGLSLFLVVVTVLAVTNLRFPENLPDPFGAYTPIMPGNSSAALDHYMCSSTLIEDLLPRGWYFCEIRPDGGPINLVSVTVKNHQIIAVVFTVEGLSFGNVAQHWGRPDQINQSAQYYSAQWKEGVSAASTISGWFTYLSPVRLLSLRLVQPLSAKV